MLLEIAIGDAYGAPFEFAERSVLDRLNTLRYASHGYSMRSGRYTDDAQMSIAVAELLLAPADLGGDAFAEAFVRCYKRDRRVGYARGFKGLLDACVDGADLRARIRPESRRNGAAMRSVPLGLIADRAELMRTCRDQAVVTHDTPEGVVSSQAVALMAHLLMYERTPLAQLPAAVRDATGFDARLDWRDEVDCDAVQTLHAVVTALLRNRRMSDLLQDCVRFGGDVDSVAAIALGLASLSQEYERDIPAELVEGLEDGPYGRRFLQGLDAALAARYPVLAP